MSKSRRKAPANVCKTSFLNRGAKTINLPQICHDPWLPIYIRFDYPTVACSLNSPRRSEIFSFNKYIQNLNAKAFPKDSSILPRICKALILQTKIVNR